MKIIGPLIRYYLIMGAYQEIDSPIKIKEKKMRNKKLISFCDARKFDRISYIKFTKSILILG